MMGDQSPPWIMLTAALMSLVLVTSCTGLALDHSQQSSGIDVADSSHRYGAPRFLSAAATNLTALQLAARYRPPIINFKSHGGPVLSKPIHLYIIWYGTWAATEKHVVRTALMSLTPAVPITDFPNLSKLWTVMTKYKQQVRGRTRPRYVTNNVTVVKEVDAGQTSNKTINSTAGPLMIILSEISLGNLPKDFAQGVYLVLTGSDVGYLEKKQPFCGIHGSHCVFNSTAANYSDCNNTANNLVHAFVPLPTANNIYSTCNSFRPGLVPGTPPNWAVSPNGTLDSMISVMMHELLELAVDPYPYSMTAYWYNTSETSEAADLCYKTFVAGEWNYCKLPALYPDFNTSNILTCSSLGQRKPFSPGDPPRSLTDPVTNVSFNQFGVDGSQFLVQRLWSLDNKGCVLAPEDACPVTCVTKLDVMNGTISRGYFFNGVGLQAYAPGQNCAWQMKYTVQKTVTFRFAIYALGYDALDYIQVRQNGKLVTTLTGFGSNVVVTAAGTVVFDVKFVTYGKRSPSPLSAGFSMSYTAA